MTDQERDALLALCLMAAFADGSGQDERERQVIKRIAEGLSQGAGGSLATLHQDVLLGRRTLEASAAELKAPELQQLAYEMAVCVCDTDGLHGEAEERFLSRLREALGLDPARAGEFTLEAAALATAPLETAPVPGAPAPAGRAAPDDAELDRSILNASILNGALELLPQSLATMAIVPLQMRLVYRVGKAYGYELDRGHLKDFLATAGVGLASQYVEQVGRKLLGGLLGGLGGGLLRGLGSAATGSAFSFATTYALGQLAKRYYGGGRTLSSQALRETFETMLGQGKSLQQKYAGEIEQRAKTVDVAKLASLVRG